METSIKKFLEFNGKSIYFISEKGTWWIAVKPICESLNVDYGTQLEYLKKNKILRNHTAKHRIVAKDEKLREMVCLPERYIYGWIFKIQSDSTELEAYQWKCYDILYDYFRGSLSDRKDYLKEKIILKQRVGKLRRKLWSMEIPEYKELIEVEHSYSRLDKDYKQKEREYVSVQLPLWTEEEPEEDLS